jgi:hypothetical protein
VERGYKDEFLKEVQALSRFIYEKWKGDSARAVALFDS